MTENEMVGCHHRLNGHEFEQALGDGEGQGNLACCSPWGRTESGTTEQVKKQQQQRYTTRQTHFFFEETEHRKQTQILQRC